MATKKARTIATKYLKDQAKIMQKYGATPKLSGKRYAEAVRTTANTFETIASAR